MTPEEIAEARGKGEVCPSEWNQPGVDQDGKPTERLLHCNLLIGHEGQHQAFPPGNSTTEQMVIDKVYWGP